jgi:transcriptional regulator with XRE-family HTH domain
MQTLGEFIRKKRDEANISLRELARQIGITPPFLSDIELGRRNPSDDVLAKIAGYFKLPIEELKKLDDRVTFSDLKRLIEKDPKLGFAFRTAVDEVHQGKSTIEELTRKLSGNGNGG